jgi:hypothetical protein
MIKMTKFLAVTALAIGIAASAQAQISLTGSTYTQDFNTLASTGTSSAVPSGWAFTEAGSGGNTTYTAGTGSGTTGDTYSFGGSASTERAFGTLQSGTVIPTIGASFTNNTGDAIGQLNISYTGEQWRLGATGRPDSLQFQYSTDATSLTTGTWTNFSTLDFTGPLTTGTTGAKDGNVNSTFVSGNITGLSIATGQTFFIRWVDFNATGSDDGLAVDDFNLSTLTVVPEPSTYAMIAAGTMMLAGLQRFRRRK